MWLADLLVLVVVLVPFCILSLDALAAPNLRPYLLVVEHQAVQEGVVVFVVLGWSTCCGIQLVSLPCPCCLLNAGIVCEAACP